MRVDQTDGLQQLSVRYDRDRMAQYGVNVAELNQLIRASYAGEIVGSVYEEERKFDLVVRLDAAHRAELDLDQLSIMGRGGQLVPLSELASVEERDSPMLISREQARRFINIGVNVRNRDVAGLVNEIEGALTERLELPPGYEIQYGGQFENLQNARDRLLVAVPLALGLILLLLYLAFGSFRDALVIFVAVPLSAIGGILALQLRGMPFSISSGIGFIALFGISVLNGIVLISAIKQLKNTDYSSFAGLIVEAATTRLRPVLMTAAVAAFGFLPMALSTGSGAEVQRPLATVVIGGLLSSTLLTLVVLPALYYLVNKRRYAGGAAGAGLLLMGLVGFSGPGVSAQTISSFPELVEYAVSNNPTLANQRLRERTESLNTGLIGQWAPLEIDYQGGQINAVDFDHQLSVRQNLNHLFGRAPRNRLVAARVGELRAEGAVLTTELTYQLRQRYDEWNYQASRLAVVDSLVLLYDGLGPNIAVRRRAGTLGAIDEELFLRQQRELQLRRLTTAQAVQRAETELRRLAVLPETRHLRPRPFTTDESPPAVADTTLVSPYLTALEKRRERFVRETEVENLTDRQPRVFAGYFLQSLEKDFAFQGVSVGVGIPLDRRGAKVRNQQLELRRQELDNQVRSLTESNRLRRQLLIAQLAELRPVLDIFGAANQRADNRIRDIARLRFEQGAIDFLTLQQLLEQGFEARFAYLEQQYRYRQLTAELQFLTQNQ